MAQGDFAVSGSQSMDQSQTQGTAQSLTDRARDIAVATEEKASEIGSAVRDKAGNAKNSIADAMESGADKLRNFDLSNIAQSVEQQAKDHPGRTLLIAAGVGYLLGKAMKK